MIYKTLIIFICLTSMLAADEFECQHYVFDGADKWLCSHLERRSSVDLWSANSQNDKKALDPDTIKELEHLLNQADLLLEQGQYQKTEQLYRQLIKKYQFYAPARIKMAQLYADLNRENDALQILHQASEMIPDSAAIYYETGMIQARLRLFSKAVNSLAKAAIKAPDNAHYSYVYAIALNSTHRPYKAIDVLQQAQRRHPDNVQILVTLFSISQDINNAIQAFIYARMILLIEPDNDLARRFVLEYGNN